MFLDAFWKGDMDGGGDFQVKSGSSWLLALLKVSQQLCAFMVVTLLFVWRFGV